MEIGLPGDGRRLSKLFSVGLLLITAAVASFCGRLILPPKLAEKLVEKLAKPLEVVLDFGGSETEVFAELEGGGGRTGAGKEDVKSRGEFELTKTIIIN